MIFTKWGNIEHEKNQSTDRQMIHCMGRLIMFQNLTIYSFEKSVLFNILSPHGIQIYNIVYGMIPYEISPSSSSYYPHFSTNPPGHQHGLPPKYNLFSSLLSHFLCLFYISPQKCLRISLFREIYSGYSMDIRRSRLFSVKIQRRHVPRRRLSLAVSINRKSWRSGGGGS